MPKVGLLWRQESDPPQPDATGWGGYRLHGVFDAFAALGVQAEPVIYGDDRVDAVREHLLALDGVLVWVNPTAGIARGRFDYVASQDAVLAPATVAAHAAGERYRLIANNWTQRLALNTARPAFSDETVRRAVAYALDRARLARALADGAFQLPTSALLPPNLSDNHRTPYPLTADLRVARHLMRGRHITIVFAAAADDAGNVYENQVTQTLRRELASIGIRLTVVPLPQTLEPARSNAALAAVDLAQVGGNQDDARDPVVYLRHLPYLTASDRARLANIDSMPSPQRASAAEAVAARLERQARYIAYADAATPELVSNRLGCIIDQPEYPGIDLAALCLAHS